MNLTYNFHTHTYRCGHAVGDILDYAKVAFKSGYKILGMSDHAFYPNISHPGIRGEFYEFEGYKKAFYKAKKKYQNKMEMYLGMECEYDDRLRSYYDNMLVNEDLDYLILGQHFRFNDTYEIDRYFHHLETNDYEGILRYKEDVIKGIRSEKFLYLAHPDIFMFVTKVVDDFILNICKEIILEAIKFDMPLEINLNGMKEKNLTNCVYGTQPYPNYNFFKLAGELGAKVCIGVDAHYPNALNEYNPRLLDRMIKEYNVKLVSSDELLFRAKKIKEKIKEGMKK